MKCLVTGATGTIGPALVSHLLDRGHQVRAFVRKLAIKRSLPSRIEIQDGDITDSQSLRSAVKEIDVIFHLAAKLHIESPDPSLQSKYEQVNVQGTRLLLRAAREANIARMVFFSTASVYGTSEPGMMLNEQSQTNPITYYAQTKARAEEIVLSKIPAVVLRLAAVYGPVMKGNYPRLVNALRRGHFFMINRGRNRRTLIHVEDVCRAATLAAENAAAVGCIYNVTDGQIHSLKDIIEAICKALGKKPPKLSLPAGLVRPVFGLVEDSLRLFGRESPLRRSTVDKITEDLAVSGERIQMELGFRPQYDLTNGWRQVVQQLEDNN